jgi:hypothetical protein
MDPHTASSYLDNNVVNLKCSLQTQESSAYLGTNLPFLEGANLDRELIPLL